MNGISAIATITARDSTRTDAEAIKHAAAAYITHQFEERYRGRPVPIEPDGTIEDTNLELMRRFLESELAYFLGKFSWSVKIPALGVWASWNCERVSIEIHVRIVGGPR